MPKTNEIIKKTLTTQEELSNKVASLGILGDAKVKDLNEVVKYFKGELNVYIGLLKELFNNEIIPIELELNKRAEATKLAKEERFLYVNNIIIKTLKAHKMPKALYEGAFIDQSWYNKHTDDKLVALIEDKLDRVKIDVSLLKQLDHPDETILNYYKDLNLKKFTLTSAIINIDSISDYNLKELKDWLSKNDISYT